MQETLPFQAHSDTSRAAADRKRPTAATDRKRVLDWFKANGPATDQECQTALELAGDTQRPRRVSLVRGGWLREYDEGTTRAGYRAKRWVATEKASTP